MRPAAPLVVCVCASALSLVPSSARAQLFPIEGRVPSLFASGGDGGRQRLDMTVSTQAVSENDLILPDLQSGFGLSPVPSNTFESVGVDLSYVRTFRESKFGVTGRTVLQSFPTVGSALSVQRAVSVAYDLQHRGTHLSMQQSVNRFPLFSPDTAPGVFGGDVGATAVALAPAPVQNEAVASISALDATTNVSLSQSLGRRVTLTSIGVVSYTTLGDSAASMRMYDASANLTFQLTRDVGLVAGYGVQQGSYRFATVPVPSLFNLQNVNLGLAYQHALSFSRRTSIGFSSGPMLIRDPRNDVTQYVMGGEAHLTHQIGRTWQATASFNRSVTFLEGFLSPFLGDAGTATLGGQLSRRVTLSMIGSAWFGRDVSGGPASANWNQSAVGGVQTRIALSRTMAFTTDARYTRYRFATLPAFVTAVPLWIDQPSVRVGFDLWLPLFH